MRRSFLLFSGVIAILSLAVGLTPVQAHFEAHPLSKITIENIKVHPTANANGGSITIEAPVLNGTGNFVTISWKNLPSPYPGNFDWIGVYSPKPDDWTKITPAKYKYVISDETGSGSTVFWLLNMRDSYTVAYFTGGLQTPTLLASSDAVEFSNYHVPLHLHLALTDDPTQMRVNWNSKQNSFPSLNYGTDPKNLNNSILRVLTTTYKSTDMCGEPATTTGWRDPGYMHSALITDLTPNTLYYYQVGDESSQSKSDVYSFYSAPVPAASTEVDFFIFGDLGQVEVDGSNEASQMDGSILTTTAIQLDLADNSIRRDLSAAVFHIGDISYARGYAALWEQFFYQIGNTSSIVPWMTTDGNHERDFPNSGSLFTGHDSGGECGVPYEKRFSMPTKAQDDTWYSINYGPVHFLVISTEHAFDVTSKQYSFIQSDLASVNRSQTPFVVLTGHRPMYIDSTDQTPSGGDQPTAEMLRDVLEPLMQKYQVDVAFWGHHHSYQRSCPAQQLACVDPSVGTIHIVTGAAGAGFSTNIAPSPPAWALYVDDHTHGYVRAHVRGNTMTLNFVSSLDRTIHDTVTIQSRFPITDVKESTPLTVNDFVTPIPTEPHSTTRPTRRHQPQPSQQRAQTSHRAQLKKKAGTIAQE